MKDMTDEEYDALDERLTKTVPTLGPNGEGFLSGKGVQVVSLDGETAKTQSCKMAGRPLFPEVIAVKRQLLAIRRRRIDGVCRRAGMDAGCGGS
ncbi:MAG: hypothetical protein LBL20_07020 [Treponema sp.]|jgi:hypothetical protein|nr:hypothetical protein [Treponema sp.]